MSTLFTKAVTINAAGKDVVLDGIDFTEEALVTITGAQSVHMTNCRVYNLKPNKERANFMILNGSDCRLMVDHCYFGENQVIVTETPAAEPEGEPTVKTEQFWNLFELNGTLANGSYFAENYMVLGVNGACAHNLFGVYGAAENAVISISGNEIIYDGSTNGGFLRIGVKAAPKCTFNIERNAVKCPKQTGRRNLTILQPYNTSTTSFANMTVNYKDNMVPFFMAYMVTMYNGKSDTQITEELAPKITIDGKALAYKDLPYYDYYDNIYYPGRGEEGKFPEA